MKFTKALLAIAAAVLFGAATTYANAQSIQAVVIGSSAIFLEAGQAAANNTNLGGCLWTAKKGASNSVTAVDSRTFAITGSNTVENGAVWVAWQAGSGTCAAPAGSYKVWIEMNTDSTVGDRCVLAVPACTINFANVTPNQADGGQITTGVTGQIVAMPANLLTALQAISPFYFNTAATDIRAEDAKFATIRALTSCGTPVDGGASPANAQYLGLGYAGTVNAHIGNSILESTFAQTQAAASSQGSFHVLDFNLVGTDPLSGMGVSSFQTFDLGAAPIVVFVNPGNNSGFGSLLVNNVTRETLAGYLDGTFERTGDLVSQGWSNAAGGPQAAASTVFVREPLSGTYNTMEYGVPNSRAIQSSQDVGLNTGYNVLGVGSDPCGAPLVSGYVPVNTGATMSTNPGIYNPLADQYTPSNASGATGNPQPGRYRAIGTGDEVAATLATTDALGYSFWSAANFAKAGPTTGKYLTVDGVDPLQEVWSDGLIPTVANGLLGNVSLANVRNGSYPLWSKLRMVTTLTAPAATNAAAILAGAAQTLVSPSQPDFIPATQLEIVRSHFAPPYNSSSVYSANFPSSLGVGTPADGTSAAACAPAHGSVASEAGGDVGGLVLTLQADGDFCSDSGNYGGDTGHRQ